MVSCVLISMTCIWNVLGNFFLTEDWKISVIYMFCFVCVEIVVLIGGKLLHGRIEMGIVLCMLLFQFLC